MCVLLPRQMLMNLLTDDAYVQAQFVGKSPALCNANSSFEVGLTDCTDCVELNKSTANITGELLLNLSLYTDYCNQEADQAILQSAASAGSSLSSVSVSAASQSSVLCYSLVSSGLTPSGACASKTCMIYPSHRCGTCLCFNSFCSII